MQSPSFFVCLSCLAFIRFLSYTFPLLLSSLFLGSFLVFFSSVRLLFHPIRDLSLLFYYCSIAITDHVVLSQ